MGRQLSRSGVASTVDRAGAASVSLVPLREQIFAPEMLQTPQQLAFALQAIQREIAQATASARSDPILGGTYFPSVEFLAGAPRTFAHRVPGGRAVGCMILSPRGGAVPPIGTIAEISQQPSNGTITLLSTSNLVVDLRFYERPGAQAYAAPVNATPSNGEVPTWQNGAWIPAAVSSLPSGSEGDMLYYHGGAWQTLAPGSPGQVLTVVSGDPAWASASSLGGWSTAMDVDLSALPSNNVPDGTYDWAGFSFTKINSTYDSVTPQLISGRGLQFAPTGSTSGGVAGTHTISAITVPLTSLIASIDPTTPLRIWLYVSYENQAPRGNAGQGEGQWVILDDWNGSRYNYAWNLSRGFGNSGNGFYLGNWNNFSGSQVIDTSNFTNVPSVMRMDLPFGYGGGISVCHRFDIFSGGWPSVQSMIPYISYAVGGMSYGLDTTTYAGFVAPSSMRLLFGCSGDHSFSGDDGYRAALGRVRVDYRS